MRRILIVDCFDSFTYNLFHILDEINEGSCEVVRYDKFSPSMCGEFTHVVFSPGPGLPEDYPLIQEYFSIRNQKQSVLGVCLGHQCLAVYFNSQLEQLSHVLHGVSDDLILEGDSALFKGFQSGFNIGHYHSWIVSESNFPNNELAITSRNSEGYIMSVVHNQLPLYGVQFHPESIMTENGKALLRNWLSA